MQYGKDFGHRNFLLRGGISITDSTSKLPLRLPMIKELDATFNFEAIVAQHAFVNAIPGQVEERIAKLAPQKTLTLPERFSIIRSLLIKIL
jgi:hypothetical protein